MAKAHTQRTTSTCLTRRTSVLGRPNDRIREAKEPEESREMAADVEYLRVDPSRVALCDQRICDSSIEVFMYDR